MEYCIALITVQSFRKPGSVRHREKKEIAYDCAQISRIIIVLKSCKVYQLFNLFSIDPGGKLFHSFIADELKAVNPRLKYFIAVMVPALIVV